MSSATVNSRSLGPQPGPNQNVFSLFTGWFSQPAGGHSLKETSSATLDRVSSTSSSESGSSSDYSRSSSASSYTLDYVPDRSEMKIVFDMFDGNKDGKICGKDLHRFMGRLGIDMSEQEARSVLQSVDSNSDGCVNFDEFYSLYKSLNDDFEATETEAAAEEDDTLNEVFKVFDRNGDGVITAHELQEVLMTLGIPEGRDLSDCRKMIQRVDSNGDQEIDITEFKTMMCSNCFQSYE